MNFTGGLAAPFPNTATVKSDLSVLKWEKNTARTDLEDLSLEGILQCEDHEKLKALSIEKRYSIRSKIFSSRVADFI